VVLYNRRAAELGIVDDRLLVEPVWRAAQATFTDGETSAFDLPAKVVTGRRRIPSVSGRSEVLAGYAGQFVVVFADDDSEQRRMEAARRDFVANVSHELKTPVGAMAVLAEALVESKDDPDSVEYFGGRVVNEAQRLGKMVSELIELSRLQGAERIRDPEPVDVDDLVDEAMRRSASVAESAGIELITDAPSGLEVKGDWTLLVTALTNLISNAVNYSPEHTPVSITRAVDGDTVKLRVTDRGIGIAPEHQTRVFERFFRVDKARSRATGGTGLGLAIVKHVAQNHNGAVSLWSRPGTGSTFTLELPAHVEPDVDGAAAAPAEQAQQGEDQVP
jgi:two-component system sensor histidine kinase SenX3